MKRTLGLVSLLLTLLASNLLAQSNTSLRGTVTDLTGAVIPGATLTLTNTATQAVRTANSSEDGSYLFVQIAPGLYQLKASAAGFNDVLITRARRSRTCSATCVCW